MVLHILNEKQVKEFEDASINYFSEPGVPVCRGELRRWKNGYYTLIHDTNVENTEFALDLLLNCGCEGKCADFNLQDMYYTPGVMLDHNFAFVIPLRGRAKHSIGKCQLVIRLGK